MAKDGAKAIGHHFEGVAERYLNHKGVDVFERNVTSRGGEIDLIGYDGHTLVFFEVRYRGHGSLTDPASSVTPRKQHKLLNAVSFYLHKHRLWETDTRIDVIAISPGTVRKYRVQWIKNAIQAG
ncbi:YraN family protein [Marinobacter salinisoli]|uniref:UPF0102 protein LPB19_07175 n=1 Tax=Marinobacter salinisoli TaxID=2769486 RepID=A0ABX7MUY7_9GAMM|nr:YraN family protein [Marinobacter salinisoli]QSP96156.1 YraN family protein [Marinobacter salinisoli]